MAKTFNELFDEFFKRNKIKPTDKINDSAKDDAKKMIDMLTKSKNVTNISEEVEKEIETELGKPDKIEFFNEGNVFFEKRIWYTPNGNIEKLIVTDEPTIKVTPAPEKSLGDELQEAVANEQFEKAAAIRDEIRRQKKIIKKTK